MRDRLHVVLLVNPLERKVVDRWGERFEVVCKVNEDVIYTVCKGFDVHILFEELMMPLLFYILTRKSF